MARVLLVDDDRCAIDTIGPLLRFARHEFASAQNGQDGIRVALAFDPDVALIDLCLPDTTGVDVTRRLHAQMPWVACVIITGHWSRDSMLEALRAGAADWLDKPAFDTDILDAVKRASIGQKSRRVREMRLEMAEPHAMTRMAETAVAFIGSRKDCRSLRLMGRAVGHAPGCINNWCHTAELKAKPFRDFSRALRAIYRLERRPSQNDANLLTIVDDRTLAKFRIKAGGTADRLPSGVDAFLDGQQFIDNPEFVTAVRASLKATTIVFEPESTEANQP